MWAALPRTHPPPRCDEGSAPAPAPTAEAEAEAEANVEVGEGAGAGCQRVGLSALTAPPSAAAAAGREAAVGAWKRVRRETESRQKRGSSS